MAKKKQKEDRGFSESQEDYYKEQAAMYSNLSSSSEETSDSYEAPLEEKEDFVTPEPRALNPYTENDNFSQIENEESKPVVGGRERQRLSVPKTRHKTPIKYTSIRERRVRGRVFLGLLCLFAIIGFWNSCSSVLNLGNNEETTIPYIPREKTEWGKIAEEEAVKWITCDYTSMLPLPLPIGVESETSSNNSPTYTENVSDCYSNVTDIELVSSTPIRETLTEMHEFSATAFQEEYEVEGKWRISISLAKRNNGKLYHTDMPSMIVETTPQAEPVCTFQESETEALDRIQLWAEAWLIGDNPKLHELAGETSPIIYAGWGDIEGPATIKLIEVFTPCLVSSSNPANVFTVFIQANDCATGADFSITRNILMESLDTPTPRIVAWGSSADIPQKGVDGILSDGTDEKSNSGGEAEICELPTIPTTTTTSTTTTTTTAVLFSLEELEENISSDESEETIILEEPEAVENFGELDGEVAAIQ